MNRGNKSDIVRKIQETLKKYFLLIIKLIRFKNWMENTLGIKIGTTWALKPKLSKYTKPHMVKSFHN